MPQNSSMNDEEPVTFEMVIQDLCLDRLARKWVKATPGAQIAVKWLLGCAELLLDKNAAYGDSALEPLRIFSQASASEQLKVRLDDKISRLSRGDIVARANIPEDTRRDIANYLALLHAAENPPSK